MLRSRLTRPLDERRRPHRRADDATGNGASAQEAPERARAERDARSALERARTAGGPNDRACYTCSCGYVFEAPVSTNVSCPHCGGGQAW